MIKTVNFLSDNFKAASGGIGDMHGLPVSDTDTTHIPNPNLYFLWIGTDSNRKFYVRKYKADHPGDIQAEIANFIKSGASGGASNWVDDSLNTLEFHGAGRFCVVLGIPDWSFYDFPIPGHEPIVFQKSKEYFSKEPEKPTNISLKGTYNRSFLNGAVTKISVDGTDYEMFGCDNYCRDERGQELREGVRLDLLFNINVRIPIGNDHALVIIDPAGGNEGPPGAP